MTEMKRKPILIPIDHGYGNVKTSNFIFPAGITEYKDEPATVLEAVADTAYREAVKVVAAEAIRETQEQDLMVLEKGRQQVMSPETKMKQKDRELVADWLVRAANTLKKRAKSILEKVIDALRLPATRDAAKAKIKEQARPSIIELLQNYKQKSQEPQAQKPRQHSWEER